MKKRRILALLGVLAVLALLCGCGQGGPAAAETAPIGIIGAMDEEVASLKEAADITETREIAAMTFCRGALGDRPVVIVQCGMGKVNAGICAHTLIREFGCDRIINTGVAGSLDNRLDIGDIVVSTEAVQHDYDVSFLGFDKGEIPYTGLTAFPADEALRAAAEAVRQTAPEVHVLEGRVCSGDQFISEGDQRDRITSAFGGLYCEMEGGAVAQACYLNDVPYVIIRAISDKPDETEFVEYSVFEAEAAAHCAHIVEYMVEELA